MKSLANTQRGEQVRVLEIRSELPIDQRIAAFGVSEGAVLTVERVAPLGDPIAVSFNGNVIALRKSEAAGIRVEGIEA